MDVIRPSPLRLIKIGRSSPRCVAREWIENPGDTTIGPWLRVAKCCCLLLSVEDACWTRAFHVSFTRRIDQQNSRISQYRFPKYIYIARYISTEKSRNDNNRNQSAGAKVACLRCVHGDERTGSDIWGDAMSAKLMMMMPWRSSRHHAPL